MAQDTKIMDNERIKYLATKIKELQEINWELAMKIRRCALLCTEAWEEQFQENEKLMEEYAEEVVRLTFSSR